MTLQLRILSAMVGLSLFLIILELVRRKRLREEYSWLWLFTGITIVVLALWYDLLFWFSSLLGGVIPSAVLFFFGLIFLLLISLYQSVKISRLTDDLKKISQELALSRACRDDRKGPS